MVVCFCLNNVGAVGLGATLNSLIQNCSDTARLSLYFFCSGVDKRIKASIVNLLTNEGFEGSFHLIDFYPHATFGKYRALQGDRTTYGRLLIPEIISEKQVVYLDSDLVVETDILKLDGISLDGKVIGAVAGSNFEFSLESNFFVNILHRPPGTISLNAGVLVINICLWNALKIKEKLFVIGDKYPDELLSADQTLLNAYFGDDYHSLPAKFNVPWLVGRQPPVLKNAIFHFVGSPKPWDFFGKHIHSGYAKWKQYDPPGWRKKLLKLVWKQQVKRSWAIKRSYLKLLFKK